MLSQVITRKEQLVILFLGGSICLGCAVLLTLNSASDAETTTEIAEKPHTPPVPVVESGIVPRVVEQYVPVATRIQVSVSGAVRDPGLYTFEDESRVQEAIDAARGTVDWADLSDINLAARLIDGTTLTIPGEPANSRSGQPIIRKPLLPPPNPPQYTVSGWQSDRTSPTSSPVGLLSKPADGLIDINHATSAELETLPGIGPKYAAEIIRFREQQPFESVEDLDMVSGIGPKRLESIRNLVTVGR